MSKHLRFDLTYFVYNGIQSKHPQKMMEELGITYQHATPQSIGDQWWFWNCENIPKELPPFLKLLDLNPFEMIGFGLSTEDAEKIYNYKKKV